MPAAPVFAATNQPPVIQNPGDKTVAQGSTLTVTLSASDPEGDSFTISSVTAPINSSFNPSTRAFTFTPSQSQSGMYTATFRAVDSTGASSQMSFTINVTTGSGGTGNRAPVWSQVGSQTAYVNQTFQLYVSASDPDGDALTYSAFNLPPNASFNASNRLFQWTPNSSQTGTYSVTFRVFDGVNTSDMTVQIMVQGTGSATQAPIWNQIGSQTAYVNQTLQFYVSAYDNAGNNISYNAINYPSNSSFNASNRLFTFTPSQSQAGTAHTVTFRASNSYSSTDMNVYITVANISGCTYGNCGFNRPPVLNQIGSQSVQPGQVLQFTISAYDPDGDYLTYSAFNLPSGAAFQSASRVFSWIPTSSQTGTYSVTFRVYDSITSADMIVPITVGSSGINYGGAIGAPTFTAFNPPTTAYEGQLYLYTVTATSPGGGSLTYRLAQAPEGMSIHQTLGTILWVPSYAQGRAAPYLVTVAAANSYGETQQSYYVTVQNVPTGGTVVVSTPPPAPAPITISDIRVQADAQGNIFVYWTTNRLTIGRVIFDTASEADRTSGFSYANATPDETVAATDHAANLGRLQENVTYYFRVAAKDNGTTKVSSERALIKVPSGEVAEGGATVGTALGDFFSKPWVLPFIIIVIAVFVIVAILRTRRPQ